MKDDSTVKPVINPPATITTVAYCPARCAISIRNRPGSEPTSAYAMVHRRPMISIRNPVKALPGMLAKYTSEATPKPRRDRRALVDQRLRQQCVNQSKGGAGADPLRIPTVVQRSWPRANKAQ